MVAATRGHFGELNCRPMLCADLREGFAELSKTEARLIGFSGVSVPYCSGKSVEQRISRLDEQNQGCHAVRQAVLDDI